ncbi:uncharacterized, partial [Tachysurus ichikawai]
ATLNVFGFTRTFVSGFKNLHARDSSAEQCACADERKVLDENINIGDKPVSVKHFL